MKKLLLLLVGTVAWSVAPSQAQVQTAFNENPAVAAVSAGGATNPTTFPTGTSISGGGIGLIGFEFTATQALNVSALGFFAYSLGGDTPGVSLFDVTSGVNPSTSSNPVAATGELPASSYAPGVWTYITLATPVTLTAGHTYILAAPAYFAASYNSATVAGFTYGTGISGSTFLNGSGFGAWDISTYDLDTLQPTAGAYLTVNMKYTLAAAPEPSTWAMLAAGGALFLALGCRRARC